MPELPESVVMAGQMNDILRGKTIERLDLIQPKCLNTDAEIYRERLPGKEIISVSHFGKWIHIRLTGSVGLWMSLGMGGEVLYYTLPAVLPDNMKINVVFTDQTGFYVTLWWFGYFHLETEALKHTMTASLGPDPLALSEDDFIGKLDKAKGKIKPFLLNQKKIRGIGNFYVQEILYQAHLHPEQPITGLSHSDKARLFQSIHQVLKQSIQMGSSSYEFDFLGKKGGYALETMSIAYRDDYQCPACKTTIQKIKTGTNSQYICPKCQELK